MIDFDSFEIFESNKVVKKSVAFIIDFEIMNGSEIIVIDLINRFFNHRFDFYFQSKIDISSKKTSIEHEFSSQSSATRRKNSSKL